MTKKQISISVVLFIVSFLLTAIIFFPLTPVADKYIKKAITANKIDLNYKSINVSYFGTEINGIENKFVKINKVTIDYNPLGLLFKRIDLNATSPMFSLDAKLRGNKLQADVKGSIASIAKTAGHTGKGSIQGNLNYNLKDLNGTLNIESKGPVAYTHPMLDLKLDSLSGTITSAKNNITIQKFTTTGENKLDLNGYVKLNTTNINNSLVELTGKAEMGNYPLNFSISGPLKTARFQIK